MKPSTILAGMACAASLLAGAGAARAGTAPDAGDYTALPDGTNLSLLYLQNLHADDVYANGNKVALPADLDLNLNLGLYRQVHFRKLGGYTIDPQFVIPFARQKVGLSGEKTSGIGDIIFGGTLWTIADLPGGEHLGYSIFLTAPTGADKDKGFAISDNRWAADLQVGYIKRFAPDWSLDLIGQVEFYQDRRDTGSQKDPMLRGFAHLRYHVSPASHVAASLRYAAGAKETLNGNTLNSRKNDSNLTLTWASFLSKQVQLQAQFSQDLRVDSGPKLRTLALRGLLVY